MHQVLRNIKNDTVLIVKNSNIVHKPMEFFRQFTNNFLQLINNNNLLNDFKNI